MTWIDGALLFTLAAVAAYALFLRLEAARLRDDVRIARADLADERAARAADRQASNEERETHLYDHRQLLARRTVYEGMPPMDEPIRTGDDSTHALDEETEEGLERALAEMGGGRARGAGPVYMRREEFDRLQTKLEDVRRRRTGVAAGTRQAQPTSPYAVGEEPMTADDFAAIDDAASAS